MDKPLYKYFVEIIDNQFTFTDYMGNDYHKTIFNQYLKGADPYVKSALLSITDPSGNTEIIDITNSYNVHYGIINKNIGYIPEYITTSFISNIGVDYYVLSCDLLIEYNSVDITFDQIKQGYTWIQVQNHNNFRKEITKELVKLNPNIILASFKSDKNNELLSSYNYYNVADNARLLNLLIDSNNMYKYSKRLLDLWKQKY